MSYRSSYFKFSKLFLIVSFTAILISSLVDFILALQQLNYLRKNPTSNTDINNLDETEAIIYITYILADLFAIIGIVGTLREKIVIIFIYATLMTVALFSYIVQIHESVKIGTSSLV